MEHLTTDIITRLGDKNPWLNSVAENYGQLTRMSDGAGDTYPVISPAALVDVQGIEWQTMGGGDQKGRATVVVTLAIDCYDDTHATTEQRAKIAERMRLASRVHWALQGWKPSETTKMIRTATRMYHLPHLWKAYETTYTCVVLDMSKPEATTATTDGVLPLSVYD